MLDASLELIAKTVSTFGIKGQIKAYCVTEKKQHCLNLKEIVLAKKGAVKNFKVLSIRIGGRHFYLKLAGLTTIEQAAEFQGADVYCLAQDLPDIVISGYGFRELKEQIAVDLNENSLGMIVDLFYNNGQYLIVINDHDDRQVLIPWLEETINKIEDQKVFLDFPKELLTLNL